jgi:hypothetical protein
LARIQEAKLKPWIGLQIGASVTQRANKVRKPAARPDPIYIPMTQTRSRLAAATPRQELFNLVILDFSTLQ